MLGSDLIKYIIDPDCHTETENKKIGVEKHIYKFSILDFNKIKDDYNFFNKTVNILSNKFSLSFISKIKIRSTLLKQK